MRKNGIEEIIKSSRILVYGIGNQFKELSKLLEGKELVLFDRNKEKQGSMYKGCLIHAPEEIQNYLEETSVLLIGCLYNQYEIAVELSDNYSVPKEQIYMYTSPWYEKYIYKVETIKENWSRVKTCMSMFADEESRTYYFNSIHARIERNPFLLIPNPNCRKTGEYGNKLNFHKGENIVDCGAYTGDTAAMYMQKLEGECVVYALEPFNDSYQKMKIRIKENGWEDKIFPYHCAVGNERKNVVVAFDEDDFGMAMNVLETKGSSHLSVPEERLDDLLLDKEISYIKMDIEGREKAALEGATKLISAKHPRLMISAYHKIEDFWELPEYIRNLGNSKGEYEIYAGHAPGVSTELEYYCIYKR